jgi:hypothetical protein
MMMKTNPITPPPEVVDRLFMIEGSEEDRIIAAYRAGADQELEAKEQALKELRQLPIDPELGVCASALDTIRRALEALDD